MSCLMRLVGSAALAMSVGSSSALGTYTYNWAVQPVGPRYVVGTNAINLVMTREQTWPSVFFVSGFDQDVCVSSLTPAGWTTRSLGPVSNYERPLTASARPDGQMGVAWTSPAGLRVAQSSRTGWQTSTIPALAYAGSKLAYDSANRPVVAHDSHYRVQISVLDGNTWDTQDVFIPDLGYVSANRLSMTIDSQDRIGLAYVARTLRYASKDPSGDWSMYRPPAGEQDVLASFQSIRSISLASGPNDETGVLVAHDIGQFSYAWFDAPSGLWRAEQLSATVDTSLSELVFDNTGAPAFAYVDPNLYVHYLRRGIDGWQDVVLPVLGGPCEGVSLAFDYRNHPVIAFYDIASPSPGLALAYATEIPEPSTMAMLGLGLLLIRRKWSMLPRRRLSQHLPGSHATVVLALTATVSLAGASTAWAGINFRTIRVLPSPPSPEWSFSPQVVYDGTRFVLPSEPRLALDSMGQVHSVFFSYGGLFYRLESPMWPDLGLVQIVTSDFWLLDSNSYTSSGHFDLVVDSHDRPIVGYISSSSTGPKQIKLARFNIPTGTWVSEPIPDVPPPLASLAMAIDARDRLVVAYVDVDYGAVVLTQDGEAWNISRFSVTGYNLQGLALACSPEGTPLVVTSGCSGLVLLRFVESGLQTEVIGGSGSTFLLGPRSIAVDTTGNTHVAYYQTSPTTALGVASRTGTSWTTTDVAKISLHDNRSHPTICIGPDNQWAAAFYDDAVQAVIMAGPGVPPTQSGDCPWPDIPIPFDLNEDCHVDAQDLGLFEQCANGPGVPHVELPFCSRTDHDGDGDVDVVDFAAFQRFSWPY